VDKWQKRLGEQGKVAVAPYVAHSCSLASFIGGRPIWLLDTRPKAQNFMLLDPKYKVQNKFLHYSTIFTNRSIVLLMLQNL